MIILGIGAVIACIMGMAFISFVVMMIAAIGCDGDGPIVIGVIVFLVQMVAFVMSLMNG